MNAAFRAEYIPQGKGISVYSRDRFFARGAIAVLGSDRRIREIAEFRAVNVLHFPDHRYLLAWSLKPYIPEGVTVMVGNSRIVGELDGFFNPCRIGLVDTRDPAISLISRLETINLRRVMQDIPMIEEIWLTADEVSFMWAFMSGRRPEGDVKRNSLLKRRVMKKLNATTDVALLVRFRLLFLVDSSCRKQQGRMRGSTGKRRESLWVEIRNGDGLQVVA